MKLFACLILAVLSYASEALASNLLANPGFETGNFSGWTVGGTSSVFGVATDATPISGVDPTFAPAFSNVREGSFGAFAVVNAATDIDNGELLRFISLSQTIATPPHTIEYAGLLLGNDSHHSFGVTIDSNGATSGLDILVDGISLFPFPDIEGVNLNPSSAPAGFSLVHSSGFDTGDRTSITVTFRITGSGTALAPISFDNLFVDTVPFPEPSTISLGALGFLGLATYGWLRRKQRPALNRRP